MGTEEPARRCPSADALCARLKQEFAKGPKHDVSLIRLLLEAYVREGRADWEQYTFFAEQRYARNLIELNESFELMVICWKPGQVSPVHNHAGSSCWMGVGCGELMEEYFHPVPREDGATCELKKGESHVMTRGQVGYISDEIAIHRIRPNSDSPLVSIHLYAPPIKRCQIYCPQLERISDATMCYHTVKRCQVAGALPVYQVKVAQ